MSSLSGIGNEALNHSQTNFFSHTDNLENLFLVFVFNYYLRKIVIRFYKEVFIWFFGVY